MEIVIFLIQISTAAAALTAVFYCIKQFFLLIAACYLLYKCYKAGGLTEFAAELEKYRK